MGTAAVGDEVKDVVVVADVADVERAIPMLWVLLRLLLLWFSVLVKSRRPSLGGVWLLGIEDGELLGVYFGFRL